MRSSGPEAMADAYDNPAGFFRGSTGYEHQESYTQQSPYGAASSNYDGYHYSMPGADLLQPWSNYGQRSGYPLQPRPQFMAAEDWHATQAHATSDPAFPSKSLPATLRADLALDGVDEQGSQNGYGAIPLDLNWEIFSGEGGGSQASTHVPEKKRPPQHPHHKANRSFHPQGQPQENRRAGTPLSLNSLFFGEEGGSQASSQPRHLSSNSQQQATEQLHNHDGQSRHAQEPGKKRRPRNKPAHARPVSIASELDASSLAPATGARARLQAQGKATADLAGQTFQLAAEAVSVEEEPQLEQPPVGNKPNPCWRISARSQKWHRQDRRGGGSPLANDDRIIPAPEPDELLAALESLYEDRLEPCEDLVLRRLHERTGSGWSGEGLRQIASRVLRIELHERGPVAPGSNQFVKKGHAAQEQITLYYLQPEPQGFKGFVNPSLLNDEYPAELWDEIQQHIKDGGAIWDAQKGPRFSSRYILARAVRDHIPGLQAYKLGEVCHIIQLAVRVHNLLGYRNGLIVPFEQSIDNAKLNCAESLQPTGPDLTSGSWVTSWDEFREQLKELLRLGTKHVLVDGEVSQGLPLSALKAIYKKQFDKTLSETAMGHTKLSTLLDDPRLEDVCCVIRVGAERFIMPASARGENFTEDIAGIEVVDSRKGNTPWFRSRK